MNKFIILLLFICSVLTGQKQSYYAPDYPNECIFREVFNDEYSVRQNGGTPVNVTFSEGSGSFNGSTSFNDIGKLGTFQEITIRAIIKPAGPGVILAKGSSDYRIRIDGGVYKVTVSGRVGGSTSTGVSAVNGQWQEIVLTSYAGSTDFYFNGIGTNINTSSVNVPESNNTWYLGSRYLGAFDLYFNGEIDYIEVYNYAWTAEEALNAFNNSRYIEPVITPILHMTAERGVLEDRAGNAFTNNGSTIFKDGSVSVIDFDELDDYITVTEINLDNDTEWTISFWVKLNNTIKQGFYGNELIEDKYTRFFFDGVSLLYLFNDVGSGFGTSWNPQGKKWYNIIITNNETTVSIYIDNSIITIQTLEGINTVKQIGGRGNLTNLLNGKLNEFIIINETWTAEQVSQYYTSTKHKYK